MIKLGKRPVTKYRVTFSYADIENHTIFDTFLEAQEYQYHVLGRELVQYAQEVVSINRNFGRCSITLADIDGDLYHLDLDEIVEYE